MTGVAAVLAKTDDPRLRALAKTLGVVGSMQGFEALLWRDPGNRAVATAAMLVNHSQPLVLFAFSRHLPAKSPEALSRAQSAAAAYAAIMTGYTSGALSKESLVSRTPSGLVWEWNYGMLAPVAYGAYLTSVLTTLDAFYGDIPGVAEIFVATFVASLVVYRDTSMIGSMWCFYAAFLPWALLSKIT